MGNDEKNLFFWVYCVMGYAAKFHWKFQPQFSLLGVTFADHPKTPYWVTELSADEGPHILSHEGFCARAIVTGHAPNGASTFDWPRHSSISVWWVPVRIFDSFIPFLHLSPLTQHPSHFAIVSDCKLHWGTIKKVICISATFSRFASFASNPTMKVINTELEQ